MAILSKRMPLQVILASVIQSSTTSSAFAPITCSQSQLFATNVIPHSSQIIRNRHKHHKSTVAMMQQQQQQQSNTEMNIPNSNSLLFSPSSKYHPSQNGLHRRKRWLVVDFDGTCTEHDTTPLLPRLAAFASTRRKFSSTLVDGNGSDNDEKQNAETIDHKQELQKRLSQFQLLEAEFMKRYSEAKSTILSSKEQNIHDVLDALDEPSNIVTDMVSESRVLEGLGHVSVGELEEMVQLYGVSTTTPANEEEDSVGEHKEIEVSAGNVDSSLSGKSNKYDIHDEDEAMLGKVVVRLRHGCESTLARILLENKDNSNCTPGGGETQSTSSCLGWNLAVLSINWCPALIDASLVRPVLNKRRSILQIDSCNTEVPIWSNSVDGEGTVALHVPGALAKRDRIMELRRHIINAHDVSDADEEESDTSSHVIVYVGDSSTDLAALLEADIGIIMGNSSSMIAMAENYGVSVVPLGHRQQHGFDVRRENTLWTVENWQEIDDMLIELDENWR